MSRILSSLFAGLAYLAIATLLAIMALVTLGVSKGALTAKKLDRIRKVIREDEPTVPDSKLPKLDVEMPSYDEILADRAVQFRTLELREEIVRQNVNLVNRERAEFTSEREEFDLARQAFETELAEMQNTAVVTGQENVRDTIAGMKPPQAKQQLSLMIEQGEIGKVVALLSELPLTKRNKIVAEFKTPEDSERLKEILELMGEGQPLAQVVDQTRAAIPNSNSPR